MVRTHNRLFEKICSIENLRLAYRKARKGKGNKDYVRQFEARLDKNLTALRLELLNRSYRPSPLRRFVIRDPKTRAIHAPAFRDRVVHHAICNILEPIFDKTFISDSYASRKDRGTHAALERFDIFKRALTFNGKRVPHAKHNDMVIGWVLKVDIRHYFPSINHYILLKLIARKISDRRVLVLLHLFLKSYAERARGMPLGALTSQLFANIYLNGMDHYIKHVLKAKFYIRYMDDFVIFHRSRAVLETWRMKISRFLETIRLQLHEEKSKIMPLHAGVGMLGFRIFYHHKLLKRSNMKLIRKRLEKFEKLYNMNCMTRDHIMKSLEGWINHAKTGNTFRLRNEIIEKVGIFLRTAAPVME